MEGLEEYVEERSLLNEKNNFGRELVKEDITNNSSELLQIVKDLKTKMETVNKREWVNPKSSGGAESNTAGKVL